MAIPAIQFDVTVGDKLIYGLQLLQWYRKNEWYEQWHIFRKVCLKRKLSAISCVLRSSVPFLQGATSVHLSQLVPVSLKPDHRMSVNSSQVTETNTAQSPSVLKAYRRKLSLWFEQPFHLQKTNHPSTAERQVNIILNNQMAARFSEVPLLTVWYLCIFIFLTSGCILSRI